MQTSNLIRKLNWLYNGLPGKQKTFMEEFVSIILQVFKKFFVTGTV